MSGINGDKSRFHRERKQKIARRQKARLLLAKLDSTKRPETGGKAKAGVA